MKTDINIIPFGKSKIQKNKIEGAFLFLHQGCIGDDAQINRFLLECQDAPVIFHYFSHWFEKTSLQEKLHSDLLPLIIGVYFPDIQLNGFDAESDRGFLLDQILGEKNMKVCHLPYIKYTPSFLLDSSLNIKDLFSIKKKYDALTLGDKVEEEWLSSNGFAKSEPTSLDQSQTLHLIYCETKTMALDAYQALLNRQLQGVVFCSDEIDVSSNNQIVVKRIEKGGDINGMFRATILEMKAITSGVCICWSWNKNMHDLLASQSPVILIDKGGALVQQSFKNLINEIANTGAIPRECCDISNIIALKLNINDLDLSSIENMWLSLLKLNLKKEWFHHHNKSIFELKRKVRVFGYLTYSKYFSDAITNLIAGSIPNTKIRETQTLDELQISGQLGISNTEGIINALLKEMVTQRNFLKIPNYEQIAFD
jgi:hypothetical protein